MIPEGHTYLLNTEDSIVIVWSKFEREKTRIYSPTASSTTNRVLLNARSTDIFVDRERPIMVLFR